MSALPLKIQALSPEDLEIYLMENDIYEQKYQLKPWGRTVPSIIRNMIENGTLPGIELASPQSYYFYTLWIAIDPETDSIVAEFQLKGLPSDQGLVEIGYETFEPFQKKGYMYYFIQQMMSWAKERGIKGFTAETYQSNSASIQLLRKLGFKPFKQSGTIIHWKIVWG